MRQAALLLGLLLLLLPAGAAAVDDPAEMLRNPQQEARAERIGSQLRCLVCQNESIEDSQADLARDLRHVVRQHVAAGEDDRQVVGWMVQRYGNFIRLRPPFDGSTLLLWGMPLLALLAGGVAAALGWRRSARRGARPAPLSAAERDRLRELLQTRGL